jgi:6-phosphogluconolactonase
MRSKGDKRTMPRIQSFQLTQRFTLIAAFVVAFAGLGLAANRERTYLVYVGTYTRSESKGIYGLRFDPKSGTLQQIGLVAEVESPSFLAIDHKQRYLYAVSEISRKGINGYITGYSINKTTGELKPINKVSTNGTVACHLALDKTDRMLLVANYGSGSVASFQVKPDGALSDVISFSQHSGSSVNQRRQRGPHAHETVISADNRFVFVPELGLDEIMSYRIDPAKGTFTPNDPPYVKVDPGLGPRHFAFHPNNKFAYSVNEMGSSVTAFSYDAGHGALQVLETVSTLPEGFNGVNNSGEIAIDKSGRFLYASNRGHDSIAVFSINAANGKLAKIQTISTEGKTPRNFVLDPTGKYLLAANQDSDTIVIFHVDQASGKLKPTNGTIKLPSPVCLQFVTAE